MSKSNSAPEKVKEEPQATTVQEENQETEAISTHQEKFIVISQSQLTHADKVKVNMQSEEDEEDVVKSEKNITQGLEIIKPAVEKNEDEDEIPKVEKSDKPASEIKKPEKKLEKAKQQLADQEQTYKFDSEYVSGQLSHVVLKNEILEKSLEVTEIDLQKEKDKFAKTLEIEKLKRETENTTLQKIFAENNKFVSEQLENALLKVDSLEKELETGKEKTQDLQNEQAQLESDRDYVSEQLTAVVYKNEELEKSLGVAQISLKAEKAKSEQALADEQMKYEAEKNKLLQPYKDDRDYVSKQFDNALSEVERELDTEKSKNLSFQDKLRDLMKVKENQQQAPSSIETLSSKQTLTLDNTESLEDLLYLIWKSSLDEIYPRLEHPEAKHKKFFVLIEEMWRTNNPKLPQDLNHKIKKLREKWIANQPDWFELKNEETQRVEESDVEQPPQAKSLIKPYPSDEKAVESQQKIIAELDKFASTVNTSDLDLIEKKLTRGISRTLFEATRGKNDYNAAYIACLKIRTKQSEQFSDFYDYVESAVNFAANKVKDKNYTLAVYLYTKLYIFLKSVAGIDTENEQKNQEREQTLFEKIVLGFSSIPLKHIVEKAKTDIILTESIEYFANCEAEQTLNKLIKGIVEYANSVIKIGDYENAVRFITIIIKGFEQSIIENSEEKFIIHLIALVKKIINKLLETQQQARLKYLLNIVLDSTNFTSEAIEQLPILSCLELPAAYQLFLNNQQFLDKITILLDLETVKEQTSANKLLAKLTILSYIAKQAKTSGTAGNAHGNDDEQQHPLAQLYYQLKALKELNIHYFKDVPFSFTELLNITDPEVLSYLMRDSQLLPEKMEEEDKDPIIEQITGNHKNSIQLAKCLRLYEHWRSLFIDEVPMVVQVIEGRQLKTPAFNAHPNYQASVMQLGNMQPKNSHKSTAPASSTPNIPTPPKNMPAPPPLPGAKKSVAPKKAKERNDIFFELITKPAEKDKYIKIFIGKRANWNEDKEKFYQLLPAFNQFIQASMLCDEPFKEELINNFLEALDLLQIEQKQKHIPEQDQIKELLQELFEKTLKLRSEQPNESYKKSFPAFFNNLTSQEFNQIFEVFFEKKQFDKVHQQFKYFIPVLQQTQMQAHACIARDQEITAQILKQIWLGAQQQIEKILDEHTCPDIESVFVYAAGETDIVASLVNRIIEECRAQQQLFQANLLITDLQAIESKVCLGIEENQTQHLMMHIIVWHLSQYIKQQPTIEKIEQDYFSIIEFCKFHQVKCKLSLDNFKEMAHELPELAKKRKPYNQNVRRFNTTFKPIKKELINIFETNAAVEELSEIFYLTVFPILINQKLNFEKTIEQLQQANINTEQFTEALFAKIDKLRQPKVSVSSPKQADSTGDLRSQLHERQKKLTSTSIVDTLREFEDQRLKQQFLKFVLNVFGFDLLNAEQLKGFKEIFNSDLSRIARDQTFNEINSQDSDIKRYWTAKFKLLPEGKYQATQVNDFLSAFAEGFKSIIIKYNQIKEDKAQAAKKGYGANNRGPSADDVMFDKAKAIKNANKHSDSEESDSDWSSEEAEPAKDQSTQATGTAETAPKNNQQIKKIPVPNPKETTQAKKNPGSQKKLPGQPGKFKKGFPKTKTKHNKFTKVSPLNSPIPAAGPKYGGIFSKKVPVAKQQVPGKLPELPVKKLNFQ